MNYVVFYVYWNSPFSNENVFETERSSTHRAPWNDTVIKFLPITVHRVVLLYYLILTRLQKTLILRQNVHRIHA